MTIWIGNKMTLFKSFKENLILSNHSIILPQDVTSEIYKVNDSNILVKQLEVFLPYFCESPRRLIEEIEKSKETALASIIQKIYIDTGRSNSVWHGLIGEVLATTHCLSFTDYKIPVYKLRFTPNRKISMPGDDILAFKYSSSGNPESLLVIEAKNYKDNPKEAISKAYKTLSLVKKSNPVLLNFIINILDNRGDAAGARIIERFLDNFSYTYATEYNAFIVTDSSKWKEDHLLVTDNEYATPLKTTVLLINNWEDLQDNLTSSESKVPTKSFNSENIEIDDKEEIERIMNNSEFKRQQSNLASAVLTSELKIDTRHRNPYAFDYKKLENAALFLSLSAFRLMSKDSEKAEIVLTEAAKTYERLASWSLENNQIQPALKNILQSAILYSVAGYNANAKVLINKTLKDERNFEAVSANIVFKYLCLLLDGRLVDLQDQLASFLTKEFKIDTLPDSEEAWYELYSSKLENLADIIVAKAFANLLQYLRSGNNVYTTDLYETLLIASNLYSLIGDLQSYNLVSSCQKIFHNIIENSTQKLIGAILDEKSDRWKYYLRVLSFTGIFPMNTLWKSQQKILNSGLLGNNSLIVSMPTSAGKTKTVELAIFKAINENFDSICVYVVPTRALASEVEESLSKNLSKFGIGVSILYGGYDTNPLEGEILLNNNVFVLTPEKLDLLLRSNKEFKERLGLVIIDEAHDVASTDIRSLRTEFIYSRLMYQAHKNNARVLCLSAVMSNPSDFALWVTGNHDNSVDIDWRPTGRRIGFFHWFSYTAATVQYLTEKNQYPSDIFYVPLRFNKKDLINKKDLMKTEVAARLGIYYSKTGSTLIFTTTIPIVEDIVERLFDINTSHITTIAQEEVASACAKILSENHKLVKAIKLGFCYHHSGLPRNIRRIIENAVKKNILQIIVSTTTLAQGVNLPIKNVIVHSLHHGNKITMSQFWNIAGRAGRAGFETEGHIIFCFRDDLLRVFEESPNEKCESFITSGINLLIRSRLPSIITEQSFIEKWALASTMQFRKYGNIYENWSAKRLDNAEKSKLNILSLIDSQLMAWIVEASIEEVTDEEVKKIFDNLLCTVQIIDKQDIFDTFKDELKRAIVNVKSRTPDNDVRKLFNQTGMGIKSNTLLHEYAKEIAENIESFNDITSLPLNFWVEIHKTFQLLTELKDIANIDPKVLIDWLNGTEYSEIAHKYFDDNIEKTVKSVEAISYSYPWGLNALLQHLYFILKSDPPKVFKELPGLVVNGVPDICALYSLYQGSKDRRISIIMGNLYKQQTTTDYSYFDFLIWLYNYDLESLTVYLKEMGLDDVIILDFYESIKIKKVTNTSEKDRLEFTLLKEIDNEVKLEELLIVNLDNRYVLTTYNYKEIWELEGDDMQYLKKVDRQERELIVDLISNSNRTIGIKVY